MITTHTLGSETWVDIDHGTPEEIAGIMDKYHIHPYVARELTSVTRKPRVEFHDGYVYCILHFPAFKHSHSEGENQEVDFVIGKNLLITARYDTIDPLHKFAKTLEVKEVLEKKSLRTDGHSLFVGLLRELYSGLFDELSSIEDMTDDITSQIFKGRERKMVVAISEVTRMLLDFKRVTEMHHDVLDSLFHHGRAIFGEQFGKDMEIITLDYLKINSTIRTTLEILHELRDTNQALLSTKQNETMKQLTVLGAIVLPLTIISQIFGLSIKYFPLQNNPNAFWIILTMMASVAVIVLVYARHKKWIL